MDVVFLDANVLFSAAWRSDSALTRRWRLPGTELITSWYAALEAQRNLEDPDQGRRLDGLLGSARLVSEVEDRAIAEAARLPDKDRPILLAAVAAGATHLLTGDARHFGPLFGRRVEGVLILTPGDYLRRRA